MSEHTPGQATAGPWQTDGSRIWHQRNPGGRKYYTAETLGNAETTTAERLANARLIAAAPELLDLLILALPYVETAETDPGYKPESVRKLTQQIRKAITKVETA